jgi:YrhK-like protein
VWLRRDHSLLPDGLINSSTGTPASLRDDGEVPSVNLSRRAKLCWALDARRWILSVISIAAAGCFVVGSVGFYWPSWYASSVTLFLIGSIVFLVTALGTALVEHGPCT